MLDDSAFDNDISEWDVSNVETMKGMFRNCPNFSGNLSKWNVSKVWNMSFMFANTYRFNSDISNWDVFPQARSFATLEQELAGKF